ncbi:MAG: hypothetical protein ACTSXD_06190 [Candidatus Heimdallarchaeaceae archaeon]
MDISDLNIFELASYLAQKQSLITEYKGINYSHAIAITKSVLYFQEPESLHARMRSYSSSLLDSLLQKNILLQAPFISDKLTFINEKFVPLFLKIQKQKEINYKNPRTREVLSFIQAKKETTRDQIIRNFILKREEVMEILNELRSSFHILMHYNGEQWKIFDVQTYLEKFSLSRSSSIQELIFETIRYFGPITVPQIMNILEIPGAKVATSLIELLETKKIIKGQFIENSSYESFIVTEELEFFKKFKKSKSITQKKEYSILPLSDTYLKYWKFSDFCPLEEIRKVTIFLSGFPVLSFDYQLIGAELTVKNLRISDSHEELQEELFNQIREYAENRGKKAILPELYSDKVKEQSSNFAKILLERGYIKTNYGFIHSLNISKSQVNEYSSQYPLSSLFPLLFDLQSQSLEKQFKNKQEILTEVKKLGLPLPRISLLNRTDRSKTDLINQLIIDKELTIGKFGYFYRGIIKTSDFSLFSKIRGKTQLGIVEQRILRIIKQKRRISTENIKNQLNLTEPLIQTSLLNLEKANEIIQTLSTNNKPIWMDAEAYFKNKNIIQVASIRDAWIEILWRILNTNLPLTITQLANLTGLSNTQVTIYIKDLIASRGLRSGRWIEEKKETQFTTPEIEELIYAFHQQEDTSFNEKRKFETIYIPRTDPIVILYRNELLRRFQSRNAVTRPTVSEYGDIICQNGKPVALIIYRRKQRIEYIHNIETLPEFKDSNMLMHIISSIHDFRYKVKTKGKTPIYVKHVNNIPLSSQAGKEIKNLIHTMQLDVIPI